MNFALDGGDESSQSFKPINARSRHFNTLR